MRLLAVMAVLEEEQAEMRAVILVVLEYLGRVIMVELLEGQAGVLLAEAAVLEEQAMLEELTAEVLAGLILRAESDAF